MLSEKLTVDNLVFVAINHAQIVGACMAGYDGHRGWLYGVAVFPEYRRTGAGTGLVDYAINRLREMGCKKVNLQLRAGNREVAAFYQSLGFETEDRISMGRLL